MTRKSFPRALSTVSICVILLSSLALADTSLFLPAVSYATGGKLARAIAVADLNGDGRPDIIAVNNAGKQWNSNGSISVLLGNGDGTFGKPVVYDSGGYGPTAIAVADLNHDGKPDLVVFEVCQGTSENCVGVWLGKGDGTFQSKGVYATGGWTSEGGMSPLVIGDLNHDGKPDLVVLNKTRTGSDDGVLGVLIGNGDGSFQPVVTYDVGGYYSTAIAAGDLNGDGNLDVAVSVCAPTGSNCPGPGDQTVAVFLGNGDGTFRPVTSYDTGGAGDTYANPVVIADVNGDGKPDLFVGNVSSVGVLLNKGDGTFRAATTYDASCCVWSLVVADMNGDGKPDLVVGGDWNVGVLLGNGDGTFQPVKNSSSGGLSMVVADLDGDGTPDVVGTPVGTPLWSPFSFINVLLNNGDGTFEFPLAFSSGGLFVSGLALADLNGDGRPDLVALNECANDGSCVWGRTEAGTVGVLINNKNFVYGPTVTTLSGSPNPALTGQTVTYTDAITSVLGQSVSGTVTFFDGTKKLGFSTVANGQAVWQVSYSQKMNHQITAFYTGNQNDSSAGVSERIVQPPVATKTKVTSSGSPSHSGQPVTFTATVTSEVGAPPDGELVNFYDGSQLLGSVALAGGAAMYTTSSLPVGTHRINASYAGNAILLSSTGHAKQVVKP